MPKKEWDQYPATLLKQAWSVIGGKTEHVFLHKQSWHIFPAWEKLNRDRTFFSLPARQQIISKRLRMQSKAQSIIWRPGNMDFIILIHCVLDSFPFFFIFLFFFNFNENWMEDTEWVPNTQDLRCIYATEKLGLDPS